MDESLVTRIKPHHTDSERSVIGAMLIDQDAIDVAAEILVVEDFYNKQYGLIFETILELNEEQIKPDIVTVNERLKKKGAPSEVYDPKFLSNLAQSVPLAANINSYANIVSQKSMLRQIIDMNQNIEKLCYEQKEDVDSITDEIEKDFLAILQKKRISDFVPIKEIVQGALKRIQQAAAMEGDITGLSTGFKDLDHYTAGLQPSELIVVAARPSMGKTAFALNIARHVVLEENKTVAIFSLEMSSQKLVDRLLSMDGNINASKIRVGDLDDYDWPKLIESAGSIMGSKLIIDETPAISVSELRSKCRKFKQENDLELVVIDYLQLMKTNSKIENRQQEISDISRAIKSLARELDIPIIAVAQLNRSVDSREDKRPMLSDLRDSGAIEQDADVIMFLYRDDYYNKDSTKKGISEVIIAKQRNGETGTIELAWIGEYTKFANREKARNKIDTFD